VEPESTTSRRGLHCLLLDELLFLVAFSGLLAEKGGWLRLTAFSCWSPGSSCQCGNSWISQEGDDLPGYSVFLQAVRGARQPLCCQFL